MEKKILRASKSGKKPVVARLSIEHRENENVLTCDSLDGWADTATFVVYEADSVGNPIAGTETDWKGDVEGNKLVNAKLTNGEDRDYPVGTILMACETAEGRNMLVEALGKSLNPDGTLKKIESAENMFAEGSIPGRAVKAEEIDASKINASELKTEEMVFKKESISGQAVKAGELKFPNGSIPMTALAGTSGDESQSQIYTDAEIAKVKEKIDGLHEISRTGSYNDLEDKPVLKAKRTSRLVIGTTSAGYTEGEVDYLCNGENDQSKINEAINSLPENGGKIVVLDGIYNITAPVLIENKNNVRISGSGPATSLKRMWDSPNGENAGVITIKNSQNAAVIAIKIDVNGANYDSAFNEAVQMDSTSQETALIDEGGFAGFLDEVGEMEKEDWANKKEPFFNEADVRKGFVDTGKTVTIGTSGADIIHSGGDFAGTFNRAVMALGPEGGTIELITDIDFNNDTHEIKKLKNIRVKGAAGDSKKRIYPAASRGTVIFRKFDALCFEGVSFPSDLYVQDGKSLELKSVDIYRSTFYAGRIYAKDCIFTNGGEIRHSSSLPSVFKNCIFRQSSFNTMEYGSNSGKSKLIFEDCVFGETSHFSRSLVSNESNLIINRCTFNGARSEHFNQSFQLNGNYDEYKSAIGLYGGYLEEDRYIIIKNSTFNLSGCNGVYTKTATKIKIYNNTFNQTGYASMGGTIRGRASIVGNAFNTTDGIRIESYRGCVIAGNTFSNSRCGLILSSATSNLLIKKNKFRRGGGWFDYLSGVRLVRGALSQDHLLYNTSNVRIEKNSIEQNSYFNVELDSSLASDRGTIKLSIVKNSIKKISGDPSYIIMSNASGPKLAVEFKDNIVHGFSDTVHGMTKDDSWFSGNHFNDPEHPHIEEPENIPDWN